MSTYIIYMAAGNSRRFRENKLLYQLGDKPMYQYGLMLCQDALRDRLADAVYVVTRHGEIRDYLEESNSPVTCVWSPDSSMGQSYTIRAGIEALRSVHEIGGADRICFMTADQPYLTGRTLKSLLQTSLKTREIARCISDRGPGNPVLFQGCHLAELMELQGDQGGRILLNRYPVTYLQVEDSEELRDIDRPEDL